MFRLPQVDRTNYTKNSPAGYCLRNQNNQCKSYMNEFCTPEIVATQSDPTRCPKESSYYNYNEKLYQYCQDDKLFTDVCYDYCISVANNDKYNCTQDCLMLGGSLYLDEQILINPSSLLSGKSICK